MPPLASASSSSSEPSESHYSFEALGFEIEAEEMQNGTIVVSNIVGLPRDSENDDSMDKATSSTDDNNLNINRNSSTKTDDNNLDINHNSSIDDFILPPIYEDDDDQHSFYAAMENAFTSFGLCGDFDDTDCHCKPLKSALKDPTRSPSPLVDRQVSFTKLKIREYDMTLGDHPSARSGPPVQLDWDYRTENVVNLEDYERARQPRRNRRQLRLSYRDRERLLYTEKGFTEEQVNTAWLEALTIRKQRSETVKQSAAQKKFEEAWESAQRKASRLFSV